MSSVITKHFWKWNLEPWNEFCVILENHRQLVCKPHLYLKGYGNVVSKLLCHSKTCKPNCTRTIGEIQQCNLCIVNLTQMVGFFWKLTDPRFLLLKVMRLQWDPSCAGEAIVDWDEGVFNFQNYCCWAEIIGMVIFQKFKIPPPTTTTIEWPPTVSPWWKGFQGNLLIRRELEIFSLKKTVVADDTVNLMSFRLCCWFSTYMLVYLWVTGTYSGMEVGFPQESNEVLSKDAEDFLRIIHCMPTVHILSSFPALSPHFLVLLSYFALATASEVLSIFSWAVFASYISNLV